MVEAAANSNNGGVMKTLKLLVSRTGILILALFVAIGMVIVAIIIDKDFLIIFFVCLTMLFGSGVVYNCYHCFKGTLHEHVEEDIFPISSNTETATDPEVLNVPALANKSLESNDPPAYSKLEFQSPKSPSADISHHSVPLPPPYFEPFHEKPIASSFIAPLYPLSGSSTFTPAVPVDSGPPVPIGFRIYDMENNPKKTYPNDPVVPTEKTPFHISGQSSIEPSAPTEVFPASSSVYTLPVPSAPSILPTSYSASKKYP